MSVIWELVDGRETSIYMLWLAALLFPDAFGPYHVNLTPFVLTALHCRQQHLQKTGTWMSWLRSISVGTQTQVDLTLVPSRSTVLSQLLRLTLPHVLLFRCLCFSLVVWNYAVQLQEKSCWQSDWCCHECADQLWEEQHWQGQEQEPCLLFVIYSGI